VVWAEFFAEGCGWVTLNTSSNDPEVRSLGQAPDWVVGHGLGIVVDCRDRADELPELKRINPQPVQIFASSANYYAVSAGAAKEDEIKAFTLPNIFENLLPVDYQGWFNSNKYTDRDMLEMGRPIYVPPIPEGLIERDTIRLQAQFAKYDLTETINQFISFVVEGKDKEAFALLGPDLTQESSQYAQYGGGVVGLILNQLNRAGLGDCGGFPAKRGFSLPSRSSWALGDLSERGNMAKQTALASTLNGMQILLTFTFVHSRGNKIFDLNLKFNQAGAGSSGAIGQR